MENWKLRWFLKSFGDRLVFYRFVTVRGLAYEQYYGLWFCGGTCPEVWHWKPVLAVASYKARLSFSAILNVPISAEKRLLPGYLLNVATNCAIFWKPKLWWYQASSLNRIIKKACFLLWAKWTYLWQNELMKRCVIDLIRYWHYTESISLKM